MPIVGSFAGASARAFGLGATSAPPIGDFESIATVTATISVANIEFTSIPATYTHLQIRGIGRCAYANAGASTVSLKFNSDGATNYSSHTLSGNGSTASSGATSTTATPTSLATLNNSNTASVFSVAVIDILDYANTNKYKTVRCLNGYDANGSGLARLESTNWRSTNAITTVTITANDGNWVQYSSFALYGVKA